MPRILLVDDDQDCRGASKDVLESYGYEVIEAVDGQHALEYMLASEEPSLLILDLEMPVMSGAELVDVMRRYRRLASIPVLILSGSVERGSPVADTVVGFLHKPCSADLFLEVIRQIILDRTG